MASSFSLIKAVVVVALLGLTTAHYTKVKLFNWSYKDFGNSAFSDISSAQRQQLERYPTVSCPNGWIHFGDSCYWIEEKTLDFANAERSCYEKNSTLFVVNTEEEWETVSDFTPKSVNSWIGLVRFNSMEKFSAAPNWQTEGGVNSTKINWLVRPYDPITNGWSTISNCAAHFNPAFNVKKVAYTYFYPCTFKFASICERNNTILDFLNRKFDFLE